MRLVTLALTVLTLTVNSLTLRAYDEDTDDFYWVVDEMEGPYENFDKRRSSLYFNYGQATFGAEDMAIVPADAGLAEIQLGYTKTGYLNNAPNVAYQYYDGLTFTYLSSNLGQTAADDALGLEILRLSPTRREGLGYRLGENRNIILFNGASMNWNRINVLSTPFDLPIDSLARASELRVYADDIHFGMRTEAGIRAELFDQMAVETRFERSLIFRRHKFWKWAGSVVLEQISQELLDDFLFDALDTNPDWVPVVSFVLKNGLSYAWYEMRRTEMNWPFGDEAPLANDAFKIGLVLTL